MNYSSAKASVQHLFELVKVPELWCGLPSDSLFEHGMNFQTFLTDGIADNESGSANVK